MAAGGDQLGDELLGVGRADDGLSHDDDIGPGARVAHYVVGAADAAGGDTGHRGGQHIRDLLETRAIDGQRVRITSVDRHVTRSGGHGGQRLVPRVRLDDRRHAQRMGALDERLQNERLEAGVHDEHVGPVTLASWTW